MILFFRIFALIAFWFVIALTVRLLADALERNGRSRWPAIVPPLAIVVLLFDLLTGRTRGRT